MEKVGQSQRLIWGGNRSNLLLNPGASFVELPTPDMLSSLSLPKGKTLYLSSCDISQFYNRLKAPEFLIPFLGLPRVKSSLVAVQTESEYVVPCLLCVPMGATLAVGLAQTVSMAILSRAALARPPLTRNEIDVKIRNGEGSQIVYIDDFTTIGTSCAQVNEATKKIIEVLKQCHLPVEAGKTTWACGGVPGVALGLWWWQEGVLTVKPSMMRKLWDDTTAVLSRNRASPHQMQSLLGKWTWACLLRRPVLSLFESVYRFCSRDKPRLS